MVEAIPHSVTNNKCGSCYVPPLVFALTLKIFNK